MSKTFLELNTLRFKIERNATEKRVDMNFELMCYLMCNFDYIRTFWKKVINCWYIVVTPVCPSVRPFVREKRFITGTSSIFQGFEKWYSMISLGVSCRCAITLKRYIIFHFCPRGQIRVEKLRFWWTGCHWNIVYISKSRQLII